MTEALDYFNRALAIVPDDKVVISNVAQVNFVIENYDDTIRLCDNIISKEGADENIKAFAEDLKAKAYTKKNDK